MRTKLKDLVKSALIIAVVMCCYSCIDRNEEVTAEWIKTNKKPIVCRLYGTNLSGDVAYTLISLDGNVYNTGRVKLSLPDTIK
jgi:hypothetical protein